MAWISPTYQDYQKAPTNNLIKGPGGLGGAPTPTPAEARRLTDLENQRKFQEEQERADAERKRLAFEAQQRAFEADQQRKGQAFNAQQTALSGLASAFSGGGGGFGVPYNQTPGGSSPGNFATVSLTPVVGVPDASAAQNAAFGSAKAKAGSLGRSAVDSLRANLAERGILGGGSEARGVATRLAEATNPLSDLNVAQQQEKLGIIQHNQDLAAGQAATQFGGNITQRGQDIQNANAQAQLAAQERARQQQLLETALAGLMRAY